MRLVVTASLVFALLLQGCAGQLAPLKDTSNAAHLTYTKMSFEPGERQDLWMYDNPTLKLNESSGRLIEHGNFAKKPATAYVPSGRRMYFISTYLKAHSYMGVVAVEQCHSGLSFIPEPKKSYIITQLPLEKGCPAGVIDNNSGNPPSSFQRFEALK